MTEPLKPRRMRPTRPAAPRTKPPRAPALPPLFFKLVGPIVLGLGILCIVAVLRMATPPAPPPDVVSFLELQKAWEARQPSTDQLAAKAAQSPFSKSLEGLWIARFKDGTAALTVSAGVFQILFYPVVGTSPRLFVRGVFDIRERFVLLTPREDLGAPDPVIANGRFFPYQPLTRQTWAVVMAREGDKLVWRKGPANVSNVHGTPSFHPLFDLSPEGTIVWDPPPPEPPRPEPAKPPAESPVKAPQTAP